MKHHIEILRFLQNNGSVSGPELARQLGISVSAVDNCVRALRDWEFGISDLPGTGYQLTESLQFVDENRLREELRSKGLLIEDRLEVLGEVDSTSERLLEWPDRDILHGRTCVTEFQSQGRGRRGRTWLGVPCRNIMLSMAWQMDREAKRVGGLSLSVGLTLLRRLRTFGVESLQLKWPNDIVCDHGKLAGILVDVLTGPDHRCTVVVGIGVNLKNPAVITNRLDRLVANLVDLCAVPVDRTRLIALIIADLCRTLETFDRNGFSGDVDAWNACDAYAGLRVRAKINNRTVEGDALGVDTSGAYRVRLDDHRVESIVTGEIIPQPAAPDKPNNQTV